VQATLLDNAQGVNTVRHLSIKTSTQHTLDVP
jgi:hypothetical protein